jgi:amino acid adenylation domain-containing protein
MSDHINNLTGLTPERRALLALKARRLKERGEQNAGEPPILPQPRHDGVNLFPPSPAQERLWFLDQLVPESSAFNLAIPMRLRGALHISTLKRSLDAMLERHEVLRTNLLTNDGQPVQAVAPAVEVKWTERDLRHLPAPERERRAGEVAAAEVVRPFKLAEEPLLRAMLLRLDEDEHVVLLTMHHVVFDEWSAGIFVQEMATLYEAFARGDASPLPPLAVQYADYAVWQREWLQGEALRRQLDYWRKQLAGPLPILELPTDRPRPAVQTSRGSKFSVACPEQLSDALRTFSRREGVTLFITLLAAFKTLLYRYTAQPDVLVGAPIANRNRRETERLIGFFVNALVLRTDLSGARSFREALGRVRETVLQAFAHQDVPFKQLIQELQPERDPSRRQPLFHITFSVQNAMPKESRQMPQLVLTPFRLQSEIETFEDLNFLVAVGEEEITLSAEYNTDLFDEATIGRLVNHYRTLLESIVADPDEGLSELEILPAAERHRLLYDWNDTRVDETDWACLHEMFEQQVRLTPEATALVFGPEQLTYRELNGRANQLARHLRKQGAGAETIVGICLERSLEVVVAVFGALKAGSAYLMLDPAYPAERLAFMLEDANVPVLVTQQKLRDKVPAPRGRIIYLDTDGEAISRESVENLGRVAWADNLAFVIYTSGSTGRPKGIGLPHRALVNLISWHLASVARGARTIQFASLSFDVSLQEIFSTCCSGGTLFLIPEALRLDLAGLARFVAEQRIEMLQLPVVALQQLAEGFCEQPGLFASLQGLCVAGEQPTITRPIARLFEQLEGCTFHNQYGPSETHCVTQYKARHPPSDWPVLPPIGRPIFNTQIYVLDANLRPVPVGVLGEVYIGGRCLARNYLNRPAATAEKFIPNPFAAEPGERLYRTGDLVHYLPDGNIQFLGRADHQVKVRGFRIELGEIEITLGQHPAVRDAVVIARQDVPGEKRLVAYVVLNPQHSLASPVAELHHFTREKLPDYMMPSAFVILEALPQLPNGKVDRRSLPAPESARPELDNFYVAPSTPSEQALSDIWAEVLRLDRVGVNDNFFELGGDSIRSFQVISRANQSGLKLTLKQFYDHPTVAGIASFAAAAETAPDWSSPSPAPRNRPQVEELRADAAVEDVYPPSPLQAGMLFHCIYARRPGEYLEQVSFARPTKLDVELFERAWQTVVRRHAALRTAFMWEDVEEPLQVVYRSVETPVEHHDWRGRPRTQQEEMLRAYIVEEQHRDFDLRRAPMMRLTLLRMDDETYQFVWSYKHLILDGWSQVLVLREVGEIYESLARGGDGLSEDEPRYKDYIDWLQRQDLSQAESYWRRTLSDLDGPTVISLDSRLRTAPDGELYAVRRAELSEEVTEGLRRFARHHQLTLNTVVQGIWGLLLSRYSGEREVVFGSVINGRPAELSGSEEMIGMLINTLPVRVSVRHEQTVVDWLKGLQAEQAEARQYEYSPLVEVQKWSGVPPGTPLFESVLVFTNITTGKSAAAAQGDSRLRMSDARVEHRTTYPLHISVEPGERFAFELDYITHSFSESMIDRILQHLEKLIEGMVRDPQRRVSELALLTADEQRQMLDDWDELENE